MVMGKKIIMKDTEREIIFVFHNNNKVYVLLSRGTVATFPDKDRREKVRQETGGGNNNFLIAEKRWD